MNICAHSQAHAHTCTHIRTYIHTHSAIGIGSYHWISLKNLPLCPQGWPGNYADSWLAGGQGSLLPPGLHSAEQLWPQMVTTGPVLTQTLHCGERQTLFLLSGAGAKHHR